MKKRKYEYLRKQYTDGISLDQLRVICKISKQSARYLVSNGIIPAVANRQKTWRYRIAIDEVIKYLEQRDKVGSMIPAGAVSSRRNIQTRQRKAYVYYMDAATRAELRKYLEEITCEYSEVLTAREFAEISGLSMKPIRRYIKAGSLSNVGKKNKHMIPKKQAIGFMASREYIECRSTSEYIGKLFGGFEIWKRQAQI